MTILTASLQAALDATEPNPRFARLATRLIVNARIWALIGRLYLGQHDQAT